MVYPLDILHIYSDSNGILEYKEVIQKQLNIKSILLTSLDSVPICYKANKNIIGKRYKAKAGDIIKQIENGDIKGIDKDCYRFDYDLVEMEGFLGSKFYYDGDRVALIYVSNIFSEENKKEAELNHVRRQVNIIRKEMGLKMYDGVQIEIQKDWFWNTMDPVLLENLKQQLGGNLTFKEKIERGRDIQSLSGEWVTRIRVEHKAK
jgi:hypothetical protein